MIKSYSFLNKKYHFKWGDLHLENIMYDKKLGKLLMIDLQSGVDKKYKRRGKSRFIKIYMKYILKLNKIQLEDLTKILKLYNRSKKTFEGGTIRMRKSFKEINEISKSMIFNLSFIKLDYTKVPVSLIKYLDNDRDINYYKNVSEFDKQLYKLNINKDFYNYDIFSIFKIINLSERLLNKKNENQILLSTKDIRYLNQDIRFYKKLDYIVNMDYFNK